MMQKELHEGLSEKVEAINQMVTNLENNTNPFNQKLKKELLHSESFGTISPETLNTSDEQSAKSEQLLDDLGELKQQISNINVAFENSIQSQESTNPKTKPWHISLFKRKSPGQYGELENTINIKKQQAGAQKYIADLEAVINDISRNARQHSIPHTITAIKNMAVGDAGFGQQKFIEPLREALSPVDFENIEGLEALDTISVNKLTDKIDTLLSLEEKTSTNRNRLASG